MYFVRFEKENICEIAGEVPVDVIDMRDYGRMNGEAVIQKARSLMEESL